MVYEYQYETKIIDEVYTYDEAKVKAMEFAKSKLIEKYGNIININKVTTVNEEDLNSRIKLTLFISCDEDITEYKEVIPEIKEETIQ